MNLPIQYNDKSLRWQQIYLASRSPNRLDAATPEQLAILQKLKAIIESVYTDGIDAIKNYSLDPSGDIKVIFRDGQKIYTCLITDDRISYHEIQPNEPKLDSFAIPEYRFDVVGVAGVPHVPKKKNCTKGDACGFTCVKKGTCKKGLTPEVKAEVKEVKPEIKAELASRGKTPKAVKEPKAAKPVKEKVVKAPKEVEPKVVKEKVIKEPKPKKETKKENKIEHKPFMTEDEAIAYTKDSVWKDQVFYHGTSGDGADSITSKGVDISRNTTAVYGQGFYLGGGKNGFDIAKEYATNDDDTARVLEMRVNAKNPLSLTSFDAYVRLAAFERSGALKLPNTAGKSNEDAQKELNRYNADKTRLLLEDGKYDALHLTDFNYFVIPDPKQVAIYNNHDVSKDKGELSPDDFFASTPVKKAKPRTKKVK